MSSRNYSNLNSSLVLLDASTNFTGIVENVKVFDSLSIEILSDKSSLKDGIEIYLGPTSTNLTKKYVYTYNANENKTINIRLADSFFNLVYKNGSEDQTTFSLQTSFCYNERDSHVVSYDEKTLDLFGNLKVSNAFTILDISHIYSTSGGVDADPIVTNGLLMDQYKSGAGAITLLNASIRMEVTGNTDTVIRQSRLYSQYQPGKSLCIRMTGVINANTNSNNSSSKIGYFDKNNGYFFEYTDGNMRVVIRNNTSDNAISYSNWNGDYVGFVDFTKNIIYYIEFAYLGVGIVKFGVVYKGKLYVVHTFYHDNLIIPYLINPNLPLRWEIKSLGGAGRMICTCGSVQSEGGYNLYGIPMSKTGSISIAGSTTNYFMSITLKPSYRKIIKLISVSVFCSSTGTGTFTVSKYLSPVNAPAFKAGPLYPTYADNNSYSVVQYHINTDKSYSLTDTGKVQLYQGFVSSGVDTSFIDLTNAGGPIYLTAGIGDVSFLSDYIGIEISNLNANAETFYVTMNWVEI